ncbi:MAG: hypothetical protein A3J00_01120 [Candidatus Niyogibacteria bacterium RIFCSPLOWO2_02_FULL_45_13]|uniref:Aspartyl/glutamyl-tRNA(Asn/Gln) amidotransferase subunit C n=1 Tax=Candidatus Niyogibacteria bacterium RIFCSPLOWO2_02_FULL_45_13 TaxID=1801725 RepID=A0A1G2EX05_9BACT|nr:MAG: hypothetical protein A3J00_01120 [Candidatus Niyogibacteria bacterium RIFCSPLOWO2_02_FULL_45_13]
MIFPKDVKKTAELARIKLAAYEEKELAGELESILGYIEKLKEVEVSGIAEASHVFHHNDFRKDEEPKENFNSVPLLEAAPETERGFVKVKKVLDKG